MNEVTATDGSLELDEATAENHSEAAQDRLDRDEAAESVPEASDGPIGADAAAVSDGESEQHAAMAAWVDEVASLREQIRDADAHVEERTLDLKRAKKRRDSLQEQLNSLVDEGWRSKRLPLNGDIRERGSVQRTIVVETTQSVSLQTPIEAAGFDTDLLVTIETIQQDYQIKTIGDIDKWLGTFPATLRAAYLNAGQESAIVAKVAEAKGRLEDADESWKAVSIDELQLPGKLPQYLREAGIENVGHLAEYTGSGKWLTDIPHVGKAKAEEIENAMTAFWEKRRASAHSMVESSELPVTECGAEA